MHYDFILFGFPELLSGAGMGRFVHRTRGRLAGRVSCGETGAIQRWPRSPSVCAKMTRDATAARALTWVADPPRGFLSNP
jgi:hypothetical protein